MQLDYEDKIISILNKIVDLGELLDLEIERDHPAYTLDTVESWIDQLITKVEVELFPD